MKKLFVVSSGLGLLLGIVAFVAIAGILPASASTQTNAAVASTTSLDAILADAPEGATISATTHSGNACEREGGAY